MWKVKIITAYPQVFPGVLGCSVIGNALDKKKWLLEIIDLHDFGLGPRKNIDDTPFGGGPGMIIRPDVIEKAVIKAYENEKNDFQHIYLTPSGKSLKQSNLLEFSKKSGIIILCGRFEGVDARIIENLGFSEISIGDYVLAGGEVAAQVLVEGCVRLLPGVLGHSESILDESFTESFLEYPQYTKPKVWVDKNKNEHSVPEILLSGHHKKIYEWRKTQAIEITKKNKPELLKKNRI